MADFNSRYVSGTVPSLNDPNTAMGDLERFLREEFQRIEIALVTSTVQAAYGSIYVSETAPTQPVTTTPVVIDAYDAFSPENLNRVEVDLSADTLTVLEAGVYHLGAYGSFVNTTDDFVFQFYINDTAVPILTIVDPSNQTNDLSFNCFGMVTLEQGDVIDLRVSVSSGTGNLTMHSSVIEMFRISELHKGIRFS